MAAYGQINDGQRVIAWVQDGKVRRNSGQGELVGYENEGEIFDLAHQHVGYLHTTGNGATMKAWWPED